MNWKTIPGTFGAYSASDSGLIRRDKPVKGNHKAGLCLSQRPDKYGYPQTSICVNGKEKTVSVHRLVALAFLGEPPAGKPQVNHIDGDKTNNRPENLEWCSISHNIRHSFKLGLNRARIGENVANSKLTEAQVIDLRSRKWDRGCGVKWAKELGVTPGLISQVLKRQIWTHI